MRKGSLRLADLIDDDFLKAGAGNLNPTYDQLARAWQDESGMSLIDSIGFIDRHLPAAIRLLEGRAWGVWVPFTTRFLELDAEPDDSDWRLLTACVAGQGKGQAAVGIHFHVPSDENCWMWMVWRDFFDKVGNGVKEKSRQNIALVKDDNSQPDEFVDLMSARRLAASKADVKEWKQIAERTGA
jgi:hypothetical protein